MKLPSKEQALSWGAVIALATVLVVLGVLQYRWSAEVSQAARARIQASLQASITNFRQDFFRELAGVCVAFDEDRGTSLDPTFKSLTQSYLNWMRSSSHASLVARVFIWQSPEGERGRLLFLNPATKQFEPRDWPAELQPLQERFAARVVMFRERIATLSKLEKSHALFSHPGGDLGRIRNPGGSFPFPWTIDAETATLIHPLLQAPPETKHEPSPPSVRGWVLVELSQTALRTRLLPELAERYFSGPEGFASAVAFIDERGNRRVMFSSDMAMEKANPASADGVIDLIGRPRRRVPGLEAGGRLDREGVIINERPDSGEVSPGKTGRLIEAARAEFIRGVPEGGRWQLAIWYRQGSLDGFINRLHHRNLALSFGVLLLLAGSVAILLISSQRAQRLAKLQTDFVAGVSHELRTPLTVICSAAENLADGVVDGKQQVMQYGSVIRGQGRQLVELVEQILLFAAGREGRRHYTMRPVQASDVVEAALANTSRLIETAGITVEREIQPDLPSIQGDASSLTQCVQNLISNAVKYGGESRWIGLRVRVVSRGEVEIIVEDRGVGIEPADINHIFEPFYRGKSAMAAQVHGTGLGLALVKRITEAMGGRVSVESRPGQGSSFTLHLPLSSPHSESLEPAKEAGSHSKLS